MPRAPSQILFVCESCQQQVDPRQLRRSSGRCDRFSGQGSWTLLVRYTDTETDVSMSLLGSLSLAFFGIGWQTVNNYTNQMAVGGVSADVAQYLTESPSLVAHRVVEYVRLCDQQDLKQRGAQACKGCGAMYVPSDDKVWTELGYCSKMCAAKDDTRLCLKTGIPWQDRFGADCGPTERTYHGGCKDAATSAYGRGMGVD
jgi:hypothetical protein